jgi:hypothetical protein
MDEDITCVARSCLYKGKPEMSHTKIIILTIIHGDTGYIVLVGLTGDKIVSPIESSNFVAETQYEYMGFRDEYLFYYTSEINHSYKWLVLTEITYTCNYNGLPICEKLIHFARNNPELFIIARFNKIIETPMVWYSNESECRIDHKGRWAPSYLFRRCHLPGDLRVAVHDSASNDTRTVENGSLISVKDPCSFHSFLPDKN